MHNQNPYQPTYNNNNSNASYSDPYYPQKQFGYSRNPYSQTPYQNQPQNHTIQQYDNYLNDFNNNFDFKNTQNVKNGMELSELEFHMDEERKKMKNLRLQMENDLETEKQQRLENEKKIIVLKAEAQDTQKKLEVQEYWLQNIKLENESLLQENRAMHNEFIRGQEQYNQKIRETEDRCKQLKNQLTMTEQKNKDDLDKIIKSFDQKISDKNQQWKTQQNDFEAQITSYKRQVSDLNQDLTNSMNEIMRIRIEAEEEIRETVVRVQDEEMRKYMSHIRNIEQKLKASEECNDLLRKQNSDLINQNSDKDRQLKQKQMEYDQGNSKFKQDMSEYQNQLTQANIARDKIRNELGGKDQIIQRLQADYNDLQRQTAQFKEKQMQQIAQIQTDNAIEKNELEKIMSEQARKIQQVETTNSQMEDEIQKLTGQLQELGGNIKNNIEKSIFQTMNQTNLASRFDNRRPFYGQKYQ